MSKVTFDTPVIKIPGLETKFDTTVVSNSFIAFIGDYIEARIVQQLHYWSYSEYGVIIKGLRWIYKPIREWLSEAFVGFTSWQLRKAIASLVQKGILLKEHLFKEHHGNNFAPKNRTYYYSVNYKRLLELAEEREKAENIENLSFVSPTEQFCESLEKQFCEKIKNNTENTSIENNSRDLSHPRLPCECETKEKESNQKQEFINPVLPETKKTNFVNTKTIVQDTNVGQVEQEINQNISTIPDVASVPKPKLKKTFKVTKPKHNNQAPWKDEGQFKRFYRALIQALPIVANARSPQGLAQVIIRQLRSGIPHTYWDDFAAGLPIGASTKPEWEVEPGVTYPMFVEYLIEKIRKGNNTQTVEQARDEAYRILSKPRQAKDFWGQFKRSVVNVSEQVERDRALGVSNPNTPVWSRERIEPSVEEAAIAGSKIQQINGAATQAINSARNLELEATTEKNAELLIADPWKEEEEVEASKSPKPNWREELAARGVKGFCPKGYRSAYKPMPQVSQAEVEADEREQQKPKTNIDQMTVEEINEYIKDPILHNELYPQLRNSDYELSLDHLGQIIKVELSDIQIRDRQSQSLEE